MRKTFILDEPDGAVLLYVIRDKRQEQFLRLTKEETQEIYALLRERFDPEKKQDFSHCNELLD